jgi:murein endopeptidase
MGALLTLLVVMAAPNGAQPDAVRPDVVLPDAVPEATPALPTPVIVDVGDDDASEAEGTTACAAADGGLQYTADLSDDELARRFREEPATLGTISVGVAEAGRVINAAQMPAGGTAWSLVDPSNAWGTQEAVDALQVVATQVHEAFPDAVLRINHMGRQTGGWLRPHQSHQSGRDVDLGFYYRTGVDAGAIKRTREQSIDLPRNWALIRALVINADVQFVLVDKRIQKVLYDYALALGEKKEWLDKLFLGPDTLVKHARRHRDHFHVRFFAPRSQELGRRIAPVLAARADENLVIYRVAKGDSLGKLANRYNSTVKAIMTANGLKSASGLSVGRTLNIPVRGPCTNCPVPPPLVVPPRLLPPEPDPAA